MKKEAAKNGLLIVILAALLQIGAGCGRPTGQQPVAGGGQQLAVLKVQSPSAPTSTDILGLGDELGFFAEQGIKLDFVGSVPASQDLASVVSGKTDVSGGNHINRTIAGISAGAKVRAVAAKTETSQRVPHMIGIVKKDSPLKTPQDLVGKKIGIPSVGGCNEYTPYAYLKKYGVQNAKSQVEIIIIPEKNLEQALRQGDIDLAMMHKVPEEIGRKAEFTILFSDYDVWGTEGGATPFFFTEKFIAENPAVVRSFVAAIAKTVNWANAHPREACEITAKRFKMNVADIAERYYAPDALIKEETVTMWLDLLRDFGEIKDGIKPAQIYTNEFNPNFKK